MLKKIGAAALTWWRSDAARVTGVALTVAGIALETVPIPDVPPSVAHLAGQSLVAIGALHITPPQPEVHQ